MILGLLALTIIAFCVLLDRQAKRAHEERAVREKYAEEERTAHRLEVTILCQRIQAPVEAIVEHQQKQAGRGEAVLPLSDAEAAEQMDPVMAAHIAELERIEQLETEGIFP
jgi:hypothetical protein